MKKTIKTTLKLGKLLEKTYKLKVELLNANYPTELYTLINDIDTRARILFDIYFNQKKNEFIISGKDKRKFGYMKYVHKQKMRGTQRKVS